MQAYLDIFQQLASQYFLKNRPVSEPINAQALKKIVDFSLGAEGVELEVLKQAAGQYLSYQPDSAQVDFFNLLKNNIDSGLKSLKSPSVKILSFFAGRTIVVPGETYLGLSIHFGTT